MQTIDFNLPADKGGGKVVGFNYSRSMGELIGTWSAEVANAPSGAFKAGASFDMPCMKNGLIEKVWTDPDGMTHLTGKDAGVRLMRTTPPAQSLAPGGPRAVIDDLAEFCGMTIASGGGGGGGVGGGGVNYRSAVTGTTCAEAIMEMAMMAGCITYIGTDGNVHVESTGNAYNEPEIVLDDSGSDLDLDGYATQVAVIVTRRKKTVQEERSEGAGEEKYKGSTRDAATDEKTYSGEFSYTDSEGGQVSGSYSITIVEPLDMLTRSTTVITRTDSASSVTVTTVEEHTYMIGDNVETTTVWRGNQEYRLFAWVDRDYTITKTVSGYYTNAKGQQVSFTEVTEETMQRTFENANSPWISMEWYGVGLGRLAREVIERKTTRTGGRTPEPNMPPYSLPVGTPDMKIVREYKYTNGGLGVLCNETEIKYETRQIGQISKMKKLNPSTGQEEDITIFDGVGQLALTSHTMPVWMPIKSVRTTYEKYKRDGTCELSVSSEWCDEGATWILANGLPPTGDDDVDEYQQDYAKFSQKSSGLSVSVGGGSAGSVWQFVEFPGKVIATESDGDAYPVNSENWYYNGGYLPSKICPHYEADRGDCGIYGISAIGDFSGEECPYKGKGWQSCIRAQAALEQARSEEDRPLLERPVIGIAGDNSGSRRIDFGNGMSTNARTPNAGYQREVFFDDIMSDAEAQSLADTIARNILKVKRIKGVSKTIVIPYDDSINPNGYVTSVSHDWANMRTTVSYILPGASFPSFAVPASVSGIADGVSGRNSGRRTKNMNGTVEAIEGGKVYVNINGMVYQCTSKLVSIGVGDAVLVSFSSGNSMHGHIIERM